jgi:hypothetical protein
MMQIIRCTCQQDFQDEKYGKGNRQANVMRTGQLRCTGCGTIAGIKSGISQSETVSAKVAAKESAKKTEAAKPKEKEKGKDKDNKGKEKKKKSSMKGNKR